jgi:hypothetical protein
VDDGNIVACPSEGIERVKGEFRVTLALRMRLSGGH